MQINKKDVTTNLEGKNDGTDDRILYNQCWLDLR